MDAEGASVERALRGDCIADTSLLSNFVNTGYAHLLNRLLGGPVFSFALRVRRSEVIHPHDSLETEPASEFLRLLYVSRFPGYEAYQSWSPHIRAFALAKGTAWRPAAPTTRELVSASSFRDRKIRAKVRRECPDVRAS